MEFRVETGGPYRLWARVTGPERAPVLLLIMGANASGLIWPPELVDALAERFRVVVYDHRDTGRSTWAFDKHPYQIADLSRDALRVLDAVGADRAHVVGMSMGGVLVQLLMVDAPERLLSATVLCTAALSAGLAAGGDEEPPPADSDSGSAGAGDGEPSSPGPADHAPPLPGPDPRLLELWQHLADPRDRDAELDWRVEHWRLLNGDEVPFDAAAFRALEEACMAHAGTHRNPSAHAGAGQSGLDRGAELATVTVPFTVIEAPADPINPPPHAAHLASLVPGARLITVPGMGHALAPAVLPRVTEILLRT